MDELTRVRAAALFDSMSHPIRLRIVEALVDQPLSVGEIATLLDLPQSTASQHLASLLRSGVLNVTPKGTTRLYKVRGPRVARILTLIEEFCDVQGLKGAPEDEPTQL